MVQPQPLPSPELPRSAQQPDRGLFVGTNPSLYNPVYSPYWDPAHCLYMALSNAFLSANPTVNTGAGVRSTTSHLHGKWYFEMKVGTGGISSGQAGFGIVTAAWNLTRAQFSASTNNVACFSGGGVWLNGTEIASTTVNFSAAAAIGQMAVDLDAKLLWIAVGGGAWNAGLTGTQNPATGQGGISISSLAAGPYYLAYSDEFINSGSITGYFGTSAMNFAPPVGFAPWNGQPQQLQSIDNPQQPYRPVPGYGQFTQYSPLLVSQPVSVHNGDDWPLPPPTRQPDRSVFIALSLALTQQPPGTPPPVTNDQPLPYQTRQPDRSLFVAYQQPPQNTPPPNQPSYDLPRVALQPDRSVFFASPQQLLGSNRLVGVSYCPLPPSPPLSFIYGLLVASPNPLLYPPVTGNAYSHAYSCAWSGGICLGAPQVTQLQAIRLPDPPANSSLFVPSQIALLTSATGGAYSHAYSCAWAGGICLATPTRVALPDRPLLPAAIDRSVLQASPPMLLTSISPPIGLIVPIPILVTQPDRTQLGRSYIPLLTGICPPFPVDQPLPKVALQPDRSCFVSPSLALLKAPPPLTSLQCLNELPRRAEQPNRSWYNSTLPSRIPLNVPPPPHGLSELPRVAIQPFRSFYTTLLPAIIPANQPPPFHHLSQRFEWAWHDSSLFIGPFPRLIPPTPPQPPQPPTPPMWNPGTLPPSAIWAVVGSTSNLWNDAPLPPAANWVKPNA